MFYTSNRSWCLQIRKEKELDDPYCPNCKTRFDCFLKKLIKEHVLKKDCTFEDRIKNCAGLIFGAKIKTDRRYKTIDKCLRINVRTGTLRVRIGFRQYARRLSAQEWGLGALGTPLTPAKQLKSAVKRLKKP